MPMILCKYVKSIRLLEFDKETKIETIVGHPLFANAIFSGNLPTLLSVNAYAK